MADPVAEIVAQLRKRPTLEGSGAFRKDLNDRFSRLSPDEAANLLEKLLSGDASQIPLDFRVLSRHVRLELLQRLALRLGTQKRAAMLGRLAGGSGQTPDANFQKGLRLAFPPGTERLREKFLTALRTPPPPGTPLIELEFRANDQTISPDNDLRKNKYFSPVLGVDSDPTDGRNWMEIRGTVSGHRPGVKYTFSRTMELGIWYRIGSKWKCVEYAPAGTPDNTHQGDEDPHPDNDHIYVVDGPGPTGIPPSFSKTDRSDWPAITEYAYMINAVESVHVQVAAQPWVQVKQLEWFSVSWLEKSGNTWRRADGKNKISTGSISGVYEGAMAHDPPLSF